jgi:PAS domain S-box-containing protein
MEQRVTQRSDTQWVHTDGRKRWLRVIVQPVREGVAVFSEDITERRSAQNRIDTLATLNAALSKTNEAIARERDWRQLCETVCRIAVEQGGLAFARIRRFDPAARTLVQFAHFGPVSGPLGPDVINVDTSESPPAVVCRSGRRVVINDMHSLSVEAQTRTESLAQGILSAGTFPLIWDGVVIGSLAVCASQTDYFNAELVSVLDDMATNLSFAHAKLAAEEALVRSNARLAGVIGSAMDAIITVDDAFNMVVFNEAAESMFDIKAADAIGAPLDTLIPPRFHSRQRDWMQAVAAGAMTARSMSNDVQVTARRANGDEFPVEASISHVNLGGQHLSTVIMRDVTARVASQRALAESESRYRSLVENSPGGVVRLRGETIDYANPGLARMLGYATPEQLAGTNILEAIRPAFRGPVRAGLGELAGRPGAVMPPRRLRMIKQDGGKIDVEVTGTSLDIQGRTLVQSEVRDISLKLRALNELRALNRQLEQRIAERTSALSSANRDLESFAYMVAHDLRAPLMRMGGFSDLLQDAIRSGKPGNLPTLAGRISSSALHMTRLVDGLLDVARIGQEKMAQAPVDLDALLEEVLVELDARARGHINVGALPVVSGDTTTLRQVLTNLVANALKYSAKREQPEIDIRGRHEGNEVVVQISDNGVGFDPKYSKNLFGVFQRLHHARDFEGSGVGLAIVRRIIERHGGHVWAEGRPNAGATFYFSLPAAFVIPP